MKIIKGMYIRVKSAEKIMKENNVDAVRKTLGFNSRGRMDKHCNKVYKVKAIYGKTILLDTKGEDWNWDIRALESPNKKLSFKGII